MAENKDLKYFDFILPSNYEGMVALLHNEEPFNNEVCLGLKQNVVGNDGYDNADNSLVELSDNVRLFAFLTPSEFDYSQKEMLDHGDFLEDDYIEYSRLQRGLLANYKQISTVKFKGEPFKEHLYYVLDPNLISRANESSTLGRMGEIVNNQYNTALAKIEQLPVGEWAKMVAAAKIFDFAKLQLEAQIVASSHSVTGYDPDKGLKAQETISKASKALEDIVKDLEIKAGKQLSELQETFSELVFQKDGGPYKVYSNTFFNDDHVEMQRLEAYKNNELIHYGEYHAEDNYHYCQFMRKIGLELKSSAPEYLDEAKLHENYSNYDAMGKEIKGENQHPNSKYNLREFYDQETNQTLMVTFKDNNYLNSAQFLATDTAAKEEYLSNYNSLVMLEAQQLISEKEKSQQEFISNLQDKLKACSDPQAKYEIKIDYDNPVCQNAYIVEQILPGEKPVEYSLFVSSLQPGDQVTADLFVRETHEHYINVVDGNLSEVVKSLGRSDGMKVLQTRSNESSEKKQEVKNNTSEESKVKNQIKIMVQKGFDRVGITKYISKKTDIPIDNIAAMVYKASKGREKNDRGR